MTSGIDELESNTIETLLLCGNPSIEYFTRQELLEEDVGPVDTLWDLDSVQKIFKRQQEEGFWRYPGKTRETHPNQDYNQLETFRMFGELVEKYGLTRDHPQIKRAALYFFNCQTEEGDFRGIYGNQYATTYSPAIMELLIKAGYVSDPRIEKGFSWLLSQRQDDGGWAIPIRTRGKRYRDFFNLPDILQTDPSRPFSHLVTGMVLRAFAAHPKYRKAKEARKAGNLLVSRFFKPDQYPDRGDKKYWESVSFPFWFTNILTALDSLSLLGFSRKDQAVKEGLDFLCQKQTSDGLFDLKLLKTRDKDLKYWICLAVCRVFKRFYQLD
ncbi:MAG: hypothetical protein ABFC91_06240 [Methanobacteriaceae archaeon]